MDCVLTGFGDPPEVECDSWWTDDPDGNIPGDPHWPVDGGGASPPVAVGGIAGSAPTLGQRKLANLMLRSIAIFLLIFLVTGAQAQTKYSEAAGVGFGATMVAGDGEIIVGSAPLGWPNGNEPPGAVHRYQQDDSGAWIEVGTLSAADGKVGDHFGRSLALHGDRLVVGAPGSGAAYLFRRGDDGGWSQEAKLMPETMAETAEFGGAYRRGGMRTGNIAMSEGLIMVTSFDSEASAGVVHTFAETDGGWMEQATLSGASEDGFGNSIVARGEYLFVGAQSADEGVGAIDVFHRADDGWQASSRLSTEGLASRSGFGSAMAVQGERLYAGAPGMEDGGVVIRYEMVDGSWAETGRILPPVDEDRESPLRSFGSGIAATADGLLIGSGGVAVVVQGDQKTILEGPDARVQRGFGIGLAFIDGFAAVGSPRADYEQGLASVFNQDDSGWSYSSMLAPEVNYIQSISGEQIDCEEGQAAIFDCQDVDLISFVSTGDLTEDRGVELTDIWGWEDPETGKEWVLQARTDGTTFIDISDPSHPVYVGQLMRTEGSPGAVWRDVKVYKNHAFIVADGSGEHGVQIYDLTQLRDIDPAQMPATLTETAHYSGVASTHNMVINEESGFAFAVGNRAGGETCNGQSHMIDIRDPANPKFAGCFSEERSRGTHDAQCVTYKGADSNYVGHEICLSSNGSSFVISDVTDKENPSTLAFTTYPMTHYTHQGWLTEDHNYFFMNDELDEMNGAVDHTRTLIWDVQDLEDPQLVNQFYLDSAASDHNLYIRGNLMYQSNYQAGLRILDITDPINPVEVGNFDTAPYAEDAAGFGGSWSNYPYFKSGIIAVSSGSEGMFLLKKTQVDS